MDQIQKHLLEQVAGLHEIPAGAYNIRANGESIGRSTTANIDIVTKEDLYWYHHQFDAIDKLGVYIAKSEYAEELEMFDRIVSVNGIEVKTSADIKAIISECKVGDIVTIVTDRKGKTITCNLVLQEYVPDRIKDLLK